MVLILVITAGLIGFIVAKNIASQATTSKTTNDVVNQPVVKSDWQTYNNQRYQYSIQFPANWYVETIYSEDDFSPRGENNEMIGGDTSWSNYPDTKNFNLGTIPDDLQSVSMLIYKMTPDQTIESAMQAHGFQYLKIESLLINGLEARKITYDGSEDPNQPVIYTGYLIKSGENLYNFSAGKTATEQATLEKMVATFQVK